MVLISQDAFHRTNSSVWLFSGYRGGRFLWSQRWSSVCLSGTVFGELPNVTQVSFYVSPYFPSSSRWVIASQGPKKTLLLFWFSFTFKSFKTGTNWCQNNEWKWGGVVEGKFTIHDALWFRTASTDTMSEWMSAAGGESEASRGEQANEWAVRANERMDEQVAQYFSLYSWLFWPTVWWYFILQGLTLSKEINAQRYIECSALTMKNVNFVFKEAIRVALKLDDTPPARPSRPNWRHNCRLLWRFQFTRVHL